MAYQHLLHAAGMRGAYKHVSAKYLQSYLDEYTWRYKLLAIVSGTVLALERYITAAVLAALAVILLAAWHYAESRGDDARHEIS